MHKEQHTHSNAHRLLPLPARLRRALTAAKRAASVPELSTLASTAASSLVRQLKYSSTFACTFSLSMCTAKAMASCSSGVPLARSSRKASTMLVLPSDCFTWALGVEGCATVFTDINPTFHCHELFYCHLANVALYDHGQVHKGLETACIIAQPHLVEPKMFAFPLACGSTAGLLLYIANRTSWQSFTMISCLVRQQFQPSTVSAMAACSRQPLRSLNSQQ